MPHKLDWQAPLDFAKRYAGYDSLVFLHSSLPHPEHGTLSILAMNEQQTVQNILQLEQALSQQSDDTPWNQRWFGYFGYEATHESAAEESIIPLPLLRFAKFETVFLFENQTQTLHRYGPEAEERPIENADIPAIRTLTSNMDKAGYIKKVEQTLEQIKAGEFYQANITRKFYGEFQTLPSPFSLFENLCETSPGSYSAYIRFKGKHILSSSPECFLTLDKKGKVESRPIKGTAARSSNPEALANSTKDRAENLMIVDLMRNDLSLHCEAGSVKTHKLFEVTSYSTLHHMASTIIGQRRKTSSSLEVITGCFPPGSMTGAPKKAVIDWCEKQEAIKRGIYSGALGWLAADGSANLSVVIRTLILDNQHFEFQMGGGIVSDSLPENEWHETLTKAKGIMNCLKMDQSELEKL